MAFNFNPVLSEIQGAFSKMSPDAQATLTKVAGNSLPSAATTTAAQTPSVIPHGMLLPHPDAGPEPAPISMGSSTPSLSMPSMPSAPPQLVTGPKRGQEMMTTGQSVPIGTTAGDTVERQRLLGEKPGVDNIYHDVTNSHLGEAHPFLGKLLGGLAEVGGKIGDTLASAAPGIGREIPGTTANHNMLLSHANTALGQDLGNAQKQAQTASDNANAGKTNAETPEVAPVAEARIGAQNATTGHENAETANLQNPAPAAPKYEETPSGPMMIHPDGTAQPVTVDGKPIGAPVKLSYQTVDAADGPHVYGVDEKGNKVVDLGKHYEKPMAVNINTSEAADPMLVQQIGTGRMPVGRMSYLLARNPQLMSAVAQAFPDFDASKIESYARTYNDFTSGKTSVMLNSGGTALGHLAELKAMNTDKSHIPGTADYNAYENKADTVAVELAKFYGDATVPAIQAIKKTLTATLPGQRDAGIKTQAQSMGDKINSFEQEWRNAAPSKQYQAPMPGLSDSAYHALAKLSPQQAEGGAQPTRPASVPANYNWNPQGNGGKGSWRAPQ